MISHDISWYYISILSMLVPECSTDSQATPIRETVRAGAGGAKGERPEPTPAAGAGTRTAAGAAGGGGTLPPLLPANETSSRANLNGIPRSCSSFAPSVLKELKKL